MDELERAIDEVGDDIEGSGCAKLVAIAVLFVLFAVMYVAFHAVI